DQKTHSFFFSSVLIGADIFHAACVTVFRRRYDMNQRRQNANQSYTW
ncbi:hypothetical protein X975_24544, partial [Stegodyphus mimosarum]